MSLSQRKKGGLVICWGGLEPAGGAGARAVEGGGRRGPKRWWFCGKTYPHPTTREQGWGFPCSLGPRCMVFQSHHADLFPSLLCLSTSTSQRGGITCPRSCTSKFWLLPPSLWAHRCSVTGRAFMNRPACVTCPCLKHLTLAISL